MATANPNAKRVARVQEKRRKKINLIIKSAVHASPLASTHKSIGFKIIFLSFFRIFFLSLLSQSVDCVYTKEMKKRLFPPLLLASHAVFHFHPPVVEGKVID